MRAIVQHEFGAPTEVLQLGEADKPSIAADEVLVRVEASSANPWDWHFVRGEPYFMRLVEAGLRRPSYPIPGGDVAGTVEAVGTKVTGFTLGDEVYGFGHGAFAEYIAIPQGRLAFKPRNLTFEEAAAVPLAAITALQGLRDVGGVRAGDNVLVIGASGGVGTFAVQIARALGARVTGVCGTRNVELVRSLGAERVIDYTATDFTRDEERFDVAFQLGGTDSGRSIRRVLAPNGTLVLSAGDGNRWIGPLGTMIGAMVTSVLSSQSAKILMADENSADLDHLRGLIEDGQLKPVIERSYPLEQAAEAVRIVEEGSPGGKIVVTIGA